ncbi:MAG: tetraacyldisaccharide 4'-kinase [Deltaproteobacteria bacterium]|nr:MAG: tetraacyldisaccharide 4'-kinase [Deltaproteobacteria bacterium]
MTAALERVAWRAWTGETVGGRALRAALVPAALTYGALATLRNRLYDAGWLGTARVPAHVVSVGNLAVGGSGKTPTALWLAERLAARGLRTGIVARGYRKRRRGVVVVGEGGRPLVGPEEGGDEAVMLARRFAGPVVAGERRAAAAAFACTRFGLDALVLDDGFQHRALTRDADLVLVGEETARAWPLPAGPLREPLAGLARARALLALDGAPGAPPGLPLFRGRLVATALVRAGADRAWGEEPLGRLRGARVTAVAGVARPERFLATLAAAGARVERVLRFPDHHRYRAADVRRIAAAGGDGLVVTTEKDLVKLAPISTLAALCAVRVELEVDDGERLVDVLVRK